MIKTNRKNEAGFLESSWRDSCIKDFKYRTERGVEIRRRAQRSIFDELQGVWKCSKTWSGVYVYPLDKNYN